MTLIYQLRLEPPPLNPPPPPKPPKPPPPNPPPPPPNPPPPKPPPPIGRKIGRQPPRGRRPNIDTMIMKMMNRTSGLICVPLERPDRGSCCGNAGAEFGSSAKLN